ncbi:hypothetical protein LCDVSa178L [Lymphocystis disease virus 3]|uniref:Uncharacterized protein n=1 Tax=Lymphocystis disease virus 3 TaxID=2560566 RepID=A0A1B2RW78_9VIRU|nr:hypothetical protein BZK12_gp178 [Lymphocystis disease virus Sa]AOC55262.1 hypothetical protein LCDVSa178L [Lymphocystis disease virus 3]
MNCLFDTVGCMLMCKNCVYKYDDSTLIRVVEKSTTIVRQIILKRYTEFKAIEICRSKFVRIYLACLLDRIRLFKIYAKEMKIIPTNYYLLSTDGDNTKFNLLKALKELSLTLLTISYVKPYLFKYLTGLHNLTVDLTELFYNLNKPIKIAFQTVINPPDSNSLIVLTVSNKNTHHYPLWLKDLIDEISFSQDQYSFVYLRPIPKNAAETNWPYNLIENDLKVIKN